MLKNCISLRKRFEPYWICLSLDRLGREFEIAVNDIIYCYFIVWKSKYNYLNLGL